MGRFKQPLHMGLASWDVEYPFCTSEFATDFGTSWYGSPRQSPSHLVLKNRCQRKVA